MGYKNFIRILPVLILAACEQNPLPQSGIISADQFLPKPVAPAYSLESAEVFNCDESSLCQMKITGHVPAGFTSVVKFTGLPNGASYDVGQGVLSYTPDFDTVDVQKNPSAVHRAFPVTAIITTKENSLVEYRREFTILVRNIYRPVTFESGAGDIALTEGVPLEQDLRIKSEDFPQGPFQLNLQGVPDGVSIIPNTNDPTRFVVKYTATRNTVKLADAPNYYSGAARKIFFMKYIISLPAGAHIEKSATWNIVDDRMRPSVSAPRVISQGPVVDFSLRTQDLNGEVQPRVSLVTPPSFGKITIEVTQDALAEIDGAPVPVLETTASVPQLVQPAYPSVLYSVHWDQIQRQYIGQEVPLIFKSCVPDEKGVVEDLCTVFTVVVKVTGNLHLPPIVDRTQWDVAQLGYVRNGESAEFALPVRDVEDSSLPVSVTVEPKSMRDVVSWTDGVLKILPTKIGMQQFSLVVSSAYDQQTVESFLFESLPETWSSKVIFTSNRMNKEISELQRLLGGADIFFDPSQVTERSLALRKVMVVTTDALLTPEGRKVVGESISKIHNVIVSSPLVASSPEIVAELSSLSVQVVGRLYQDTKSFTLQVLPDSKLSGASTPMGLQGALTSESFAPAQLAASGDSKCVRLFRLQKSIQDFTVGYSCKRASGGKLVVLGFELGDLLLAPENIAVPQAWGGEFADNSDELPPPPPVDSTPATQGPAPIPSPTETETPTETRF